MKYCLVSLGCQMNLSDSERVGSVLDALGYERTDKEEDANILGLVACSVRQRAIDRAIAKIRRWNSWKDRKNLLTFATGCVLPADRERFDELFDLSFPMNELPLLPSMIRQYGVVTPVGLDVPLDGVVPVDSHLDPDRGFWHIRPAYRSSFEAFVPIQNGCDKFCTFCAVPYTRGREVSRPSADILEEVESLIEQGYRSITLLGQNVNSYGLDRRGAELGFAGLLGAIGRMGQRSGRRFWTYFTSPHPRDMTDDVLETIAEYPHLAKQIHLPLQSGDDRVLIRMNRKHGVEDYRLVAESVRRILPDATLFTDIIVGFPGETRQQFEATRCALREFRYNMAYIAMYSPRPGTRSARWEDDVPHDEKQRRLHELSDELKEISLVYNRSLLDREVEVLVNGFDRKEGYLSAKTEGKIIVRFPSEDHTLVGGFATVKVTGAAEMSVEGELVRAGSAVPTR